MKKSRVRVMVAMMVVALVFCFWLTGCAKKAIQQGDASGTQVTQAQTTDTAKPATVAETAKQEVKAEAAAAPKAVAIPFVEFENVYFEYDSSFLSSNDRFILNRHGEWLKKYKTTRLLIEGHCDERGTTEYNLALGERRASEAMQYLVSLGIEKERITTISYGKERPVDPGHNESAWSKNRRAQFFVRQK